MSEWLECKLSEVAELTVGFVGSMTNEYVESGIPFLRSKNVNPFSINYSDLKFISEKFHAKIRKSTLSPGDVVIVRTGKPGTCCVIPTDLKNANCSDLVIVRPGPKLDSYYFSYFMNSLGGNHVSAHLVGAVQQHFNVKSAKDMLFKLPSLPEQKAIAHILGTLDDKIELNRQMNQTLEAMAQAMFKSWFVDFDPVLDNALAAGNDIPDELQAMAEKRELVPSSKKLISKAPELAALFPSSFVFNETLGKWIPEGWEVKKIGDCEIYISDFVANGSFASLKENVTLYPEEKEYALFMRNTDLKSGFVKKVYVDKHAYDFLKKSKLLGGEVIISNVGDVGSVYRCPDLDIPMTLGNNVILLNSNFNNFLYQFFIGPLGQALIDGIKGGSAQPKFNKTDFKSQSILFPSKVILTEFERIDSLNRNKLESVKKNIETLTELRDRLLPELISGRVRVKNTK
jgi:type I restriction enzyme S subunit